MSVSGRYGKHESRRTTVRQLSPNTSDSRQVCLAAQSALCADLTSKERDLTGKFLQLVYHGIDCALEEGNFRVHFLGVDEDLFAQISHGDGCDNGTDFPQSLLESQVGWKGG